MGVAPQQSCRPMLQERADLKISSHPAFFAVPHLLHDAVDTDAGVSLASGALQGHHRQAQRANWCGFLSAAWGWLLARYRPSACRTAVLCCAAKMLFGSGRSWHSTASFNFYVCCQPAGRIRNCVCTAVAACHTATAGLCMCPSHWQWETACQRTSFMYVVLSDSDMQACATTAQ